MELTGKSVAVLGGRHGLLGQAVCHELERSGIRPLPLSRQDFNASEEAETAKWLDKVQPDILVNCIAYTAVDMAEDERDLAFALNKRLPQMLGRLARSRAIPLVHFSTDFVFDGHKRTPYKPDDATNPLSVYGESKLAGEKALLDEGADNTLIIRTAWLFGPGKTNFVHKMLQLAKQRESLSVVHDQIGSPTYTRDLAEMTLALMQNDCRGVYHAVNSGRASWCELAAEAIKAAGLQCRVDPIPTSGYPTRAARPPYSVLDTARLTECTGYSPRPWVKALRDYVFGDLASELEND